MSRPTLHVRERVQGRLVSGSWTPQCLLGSNTLPGKQTDRLSRPDAADSLLSFRNPAGAEALRGTQARLYPPRPLAFSGQHALGSVHLSAAVLLTSSW